jgi:hypothetical protein
MRKRFALSAVLAAAMSFFGGAASAEDQQPTAGIQVPASFDELSQPITFEQPKMMANAPAPHDPNYKAGRGLVTLSGMSGMFLNPTSGTLDEGQLTAQYCLVVDHFNLNSVVGHGLMVTYGVKDWLEVGVFGNVAEIDGFDRRWFNNAVAVVGPIARVRLMKETATMPELSIGGMYLDGGSQGDLLYRAEAFLAASKHWELNPDGFCRSFRLHAGTRYFTRSETPNVFPKSVLGSNDSWLIYGGAEVEFPYNIFLVGEISTNNINYVATKNLPYGVGFQWRPTGVLGLSLGYVDPQFTGLHNGLWFGIGLNFKI